MKHHSVPDDASREVQFAAFEDLLRHWNRRINLIARGDEPHIQQRHIADSLQLVPLIPPSTARAIDLGSGAGFPGLILAAATGIPFDLIEADQRKAAFLREAARLLAAPVAVHATRIEAAMLPPAHLITARALAPLPGLLRLAAPLLADDGILLLLKGAGVEPELTAAFGEWHMQVDRIRSRTAPGAVILRITELRRAPTSA